MQLKMEKVIFFIMMNDSITVIDKRNSFRSTRIRPKEALECLHFSNTITMRNSMNMPSMLRGVKKNITRTNIFYIISHKSKQKNCQRVKMLEQGRLTNFDAGPHELNFTSSGPEMCKKFEDYIFFFINQIFPYYNTAQYSEINQIS